MVIQFRIEKTQAWRQALDDSMARLVETLNNYRDAEGNPISVPSLIRMFVVFVALVAYFLFMEYLGFVIISFLLMAFLFLRVALMSRS